MDIKNSVISIMSKNLITLHPKDKIKRAKEIFEELDIHHIPVVIMDEVVGIISQGDILFLNRSLIHSSFDDFLRKTKLSIDAVEEIMTPNVICLNHDSTISDALEVMLNRHVNALPIVENNKIIGLLTTRDILKALKNS